MSRARQRGTDPFDRFNDDPTRHKHGGTDTSRAAWKKARRGRARCQIEVLDVLHGAYPDGLTGKEIAARIGKPFHAVSGRITELLEECLVRKSAEIRNGGHVIYLEKGESSSEKDDHPSAPPTPSRNAAKAQIVRLVNAEDYWGALRVAHEHNIPCTIALLEVTI